MTAFDEGPQRSNLFPIATSSATFDTGNIGSAGLQSGLVVIKFAVISAGFGGEDAYCALSVEGVRFHSGQAGSGGNFDSFPLSCDIAIGPLSQISISELTGGPWDVGVWGYWTPGPSGFLV